MKNWLKVVFVIAVFNSCYGPQLDGKWFVIDASDYHNDHYRRIYEFQNDRLLIHDLVEGKRLFKIQSLDSNRMVIDSSDNIRYEFIGDTLFLRYPYTTLKLLNYRPQRISFDPNDLESTLMNNNWTYEYDGLVFEVELTTQPEHSERLRKSNVDVSTKQRYIRSLELPFWCVAFLDGQPIIVIEDLLINFYANAFFIERITEQTISTSTWRHGQRYQVTFTAKESISNDDLRKKNELLTKSWQLDSFKEFEYPQPDDSASLIELGPLYGPPVNHNTIIHNSDLTEHNLQYTFNTDSTFSLKVGENHICDGEWQLRANGKIVVLNTTEQYLMEYEADCRGFVIYELNAEQLKIGQDLPIYQNDSLVHENYYYLDFN